MTDAVTVFAEHRPMLLGIAYRVLGRWTDAEDVVQDAWLRWSQVADSGVEAPRAYLVQVVTRLAIDRLRREAARRESYVGPWLPEPVPDPLLVGPDIAEHVELADTVSIALLTVLESLSPAERAVFVLHEAFALPYAEIAEALERSGAGGPADGPPRPGARARPQASLPARSGRAGGADPPISDRLSGR